MVIYVYLHCYLYFYILFIYFREMGSEEEKEGEKHNDWLPLTCP